MKAMIFSLLALALLIYACAKPKATVFKDETLNQEEQVKFCFTGDMGKDTPHQKTIAEALNREGCHRIFFMGDLVYPKGIASITDPEFTNKFEAYYQPLFNDNPDLVMALLLGNHDHKGSPSAWREVSGVDDRFFFPYYYYFIDYGGLCIVALDTSFYYYTENVNEIGEQTRWLMELQPRLKDCDVKVALTHHPFKGVGFDSEDDWEGSSGLLKVFLDTYVIGVFDIHLAGHVHVVVDDGQDEGTRMLISGAGGETRAGNRAGYIVLNWNRTNPKRIGYALKYIDTETNVVDDSASLIQAQEEKKEPEYIIRKHRVESNFIERYWERLKAYVQGDLTQN